MEGQLNEHFMTGISMLLAACFISSFLVVVSLTRAISNYTSDQELLQMELMEYRKFNQYDNRTVYAQDVISAVLQFRGEPAVTVQRKDATWATWSLTVEASPYTTAQISAMIPTDVVYLATIIRGANDEVIGLQFVAQ